MDKKDLERELLYIKKVEDLKKELGETYFNDLIGIVGQLNFWNDDGELCRNFYRKVSRFFKREKSKEVLMRHLSKYFEEDINKKVTTIEINAIDPEVFAKSVAKRWEKMHKETE